MLCILFLETLGLFHCFRKHEGFLFPWDSAACAGNGDLWDEVGRFWEGSDSCFSSELCELLRSLWVLVLWLCRAAPKESTMEMHFGDFCMGIFFRWIREFPHFSGMPGGPIEAIEQHDLNRAGEIPGVSMLCMSEVSAQRLLVSLWGFTSEPFPLTDLNLWGLESQERAGAHSEGFLGLENVQETVGSWNGLSEIIFRKSVQ